MATLTVQDLDRTVLSEDANLQAAASGGDQCANDGRTFLVVDNGDTAAHDVQPDAVVQAFGKDVDPDPITVTAGERWLIGPFPVSDFGTTLNWTYPTGVTSVQVAAVRLSHVTA